jgi:hypothetical protein
MSQIDTAQQRAERKAVELLGRMGLCGHPAASQFVGDIVEHDKQTRREALAEAEKMVLSYGAQARDEDLSGGYTAELAARALDRLREGR